ncbi:MAG: VCBS repeat-containing protein [Bryobacterales bacterium]
MRFALRILACAAAMSAALAQGPATRNAAPVAAAKRSGKPFDAKLVDIAASAGLASMKSVYGGDKTKKFILEANGPGAAMVDVDGDGKIDLFVGNGRTLEGEVEGATSKLFRNLGGGKFEDFTAKAGVGRAGWGGGVCAGDVDNDGDSDLYVAYWGANAFYLNDGKGVFTESAAKAGIAGGAKEWTSGCTFLDYDRDGKLDLFTTQYQQFDPATAPPPGKASNCQWKGMSVFCGPRGLPFGDVTLYRNKGDGTFEDVSEKAGVRGGQHYYAFTPVAVDLDEDGWLDLYVACDSTPNLFFLNNGDGTFSDFAAETGLAFNEHGFEQGGMGIGVGDFNRDGRLDLIKTNFAGDYPNLYENQGDGIFEDVVLRAGLGVNPRFVGWGVGLVDLDNDGWQDVLQVNGHVYPRSTRSPASTRSTVSPTSSIATWAADVSKTLPISPDRDSNRNDPAAGPRSATSMTTATSTSSSSTWARRSTLLRNDLANGAKWIRFQLKGPSPIATPWARP